MPTLHLIVESSDTKPLVGMDVDAAMLIGDCIVELVTRLGYPQRDSLGSPVVYQLRAVSQEHPLLSMQRFSEAGIASGTRCVLESGAANDATRPIVYPGALPVTQATSGAGRQWSRRSVLLLITACAAAGLTSGFSVALAQRRSSPRVRAVSSLPSPGSAPGALVPRAATARLTFGGHQQTVRALGWSPNGQLLASGGDDGQLLVWSMTDGTVRQRLLHSAPVSALAWSPESRRIVTGAANQVAFFTARTGALLANRAQQHTAAVTTLAWTGHDQQQVASGSLDRRAIIWNPTDYSPQTIFTKHEAPIEGISWAADGRTVASCSQGGVVRVWHAESGREIHALFQDGQHPLRALAFAPTGAMLVAGGDDGGTRLWGNGLLCQITGTQNDAPVCQDRPVRLKGTNSAIRALAWSPDGRYLASGNSAGVCTLWNVASLQPLFAFAVAPGQAIHSLSWSPTGGELATAAGNTGIIWSLHA